MNLSAKVTTTKPRGEYALTPLCCPVRCRGRPSLRDYHRVTKRDACFCRALRKPDWKFALDSGILLLEREGLQPTTHLREILHMAKAAKAAKKPSAILPKAKDKGYTKGKLIAHLAADASSKGVGEVNKKQATALLDSLVGALFSYASVGATLPGLGKVVLRQIPAKPARTIMSFGQERKVAAKGKSQKLVFRFSKEAKEKFKK